MKKLGHEELNLLVFQYLNASGFVHTAFNFKHEAAVKEYTIDGKAIPGEALIRCVDKGLQFIELEANLIQPNDDTDEEFSFLQPLHLITMDVQKLQQIVDKRRKKASQSKEKELLAREREGAEGLILLVEQATEDAGTIPRSDMMILERCPSEVCCCAWSPAGSILASGTVAGIDLQSLDCDLVICCIIHSTRDSTTKIWTIAGSEGPSFGNAPVRVVELKDIRGKKIMKRNEVSSVDWKGDGTLLATGSYDGHARIWDTNGVLRGTLSKHTEAIMLVKWNKNGKYIITGGGDQLVIVWDAKTREVKQEFDCHLGSTLDADWKNNLTFATSATDNMVYVCTVGDTLPLKTFKGHKDEVNCVRWDPTGSWLASCSDDKTAKIWTMKQNKYVHDLTEHTREVYSIRWSPTGPRSRNPNLPLLLASTSLDSTVKLWDVERGKVIRSLNGHSAPVLSLDFSPDGQYLATGSQDKSVLIWSLKDCKIVKTYTGGGEVLQVCWNHKGDKLAACFSKSAVCALDFMV